MKQVLTGKTVSIAAVFLFVSVWAGLFFTAPRLPPVDGSSRAIMDQNGHLLRLTLSPDQKYRLPVPLGEISPLLIQATLLQEDQYFRWHPGINPFSLIRAAVATYVTHTRRIGASTLTMQVARIRFGLHSKTVYGKGLQMLRAVQLEMHYSKNEILTAYLNSAPYGNNIEGVAAASLIYFGKPVNQLTLPEVLTLAVIPQNPIHRASVASRLKNSRNKLFLRWVQKHPEDHSQQSMMELPLQMQAIHHLPFLAPHFVNSILKEHQTTTHTVVTTLDIHLQTLMEKIVHQYLLRKKNQGVYNAALLLLDSRDMRVRALVGSANFFDHAISGQINGTDIKRSPGSTLKPFIYGLAIDQGLIHPDTVLKDVPHSFGNYTPDNFDGDFIGPIHARDALISSRNIPAIELSAKLTHPNLYELLQRAHISHLKSESYYGLALTLGGADITLQELVSLYAMLANDGRWQPLRFLEHQPLTLGTRLLSPEAAFLVLDMLKNTARPEGYDALEQENVSWKTGTSSGYRDAWSIGTVGPYVLAVWVGNFDNTGNAAFVGKDMAAPLFFAAIAGLHQEMGSIPLLAKNLHQLHLTKIPVCKASGLLPTRYCNDTELTWFIPGKSPIQTDSVYREIAIDPHTGLRTCHVDQHTRFEIAEFWPSDLLKIFREAGVQRRVPPPFTADCAFRENNGMRPEMISPKTEIAYVIRANTDTPVSIPFTAITDADVATLHWFLNNSYLGKTGRDAPYLWLAKAGKYTVRVVDDQGRSDARDINVQMEK